jgi:thiamine-phosphate pyrophosphorylase
MLPNPPILVITDRKRSNEPLENRAAALFRGGCRWLSVREKDLAAAERLALLRRLSEIARAWDATLGVHDDVESAAACGTALHLPAEANLADARARLSHNSLLGQSCHNGVEMATAIAAGADYVTLSPFFESASKPGYGPSIGLSQQLAAIIDAVKGPVIALGGIGIATIPGLAASGVQGVAIMGEAMTAADPEAWFREIAQCWKDVTNGF